MKRRFIVYSVWFMAIMLVPFFTFSKSYAYTVSSDELIERAKDLDSRTVVYRGELVTGILNRGAHSWINLNDGSNAIGVWCDTDLLKNIKHAGSYKTKGDIIEVEGIFNRACSEHGGELDMHAYRIDIMKNGFRMDERIDKKIPLASLIFFLFTALLIVRYRDRV